MFYFDCKKIFQLMRTVSANLNYEIQEDIANQATYCTCRRLRKYFSTLEYLIREAFYFLYHNK